MNNQGGVGIPTAIMLVSFILLAVATASIITSDTGDISEDNLQKIVKSATDEISTYIQIKDIVGKYYSSDNSQSINKIAILIKPLFPIEIDASELMVKISNNNHIKMLYYSGQAEFINSSSLFEHHLWDYANENEFSFIVTRDKDLSLVNHDTLNDNTDTAYLTIKLPGEFTMRKGNTITITLFPETGITRTIEIEAPLPMKQVVSLM